MKFERKKKCFMTKTIVFNKCFVCRGIEQMHYRSRASFCQLCRVPVSRLKFVRVVNCVVNVIFFANCRSNVKIQCMATPPWDAVTNKGQQEKDPCAREQKDAGPYRVLRRVKESSCTTDAGTYSVLRRVKESS
jgi:hypothetical protein